MKQVIGMIMGIVVMVAFAQSGMAQTNYTWTQNAGGTQSWANATNWLGGAVPNPVAGDTIAMNMAMSAATYMDLEADRTFERWDGTYHGFGSRAFFINSGHTITLAGTTPTIDVNDGTLTVNNQLSGTGGMKKEGGGKLVLNNAGNDFSGGFEFASGTLEAASDGAFGDPSNDITVSGSVTFSLANNISYVRDFVINNGVTLTFVDKEARTLSGALSGQGGVNLNPSGFGTISLTLSSTSNTFTGPIKAGNDSAVNFTVNSLADSTNTFELNLSNKGSTKFIYGSGAIVPLVFNQRPVILSGNQTSSHILENANTNAANTITINTDITVTSTTDRKLILQGVNTGDNTIAGAILGATNSVTSLEKSGSGTWVLSGENTFKGSTTISGGILKLAGSDTLSNTGRVTIASGAKLELAAGVREQVGELKLGSGSVTNMVTYGSSSSNAQQQDDTYFAGSGILYVGMDPPPLGTLLLVR